MTNDDERRARALRRIADALGVPIERFFADAPADDALECLRLWDRLRTDAGRRTALDALRRIIDDEES